MNECVEKNQNTPNAKANLWKQNPRLSSAATQVTVTATHHLAKTRRNDASPDVRPWLRA